MYIPWHLGQAEARAKAAEDELATGATGRLFLRQVHI